MKRLRILTLILAVVAYGIHMYKLSLAQESTIVYGDVIPDEWFETTGEILTPDADRRMADKTYRKHNEEEDKIQKLIYMAKEYIKPTYKLAKKVASFFDKEDKRCFEETNVSSASNVSQDFSGFNIAAYHGVKETNLSALIESSQARYVEFPSSKEDLASHSALSDEDFSYKIAGDILMQAKDNNADFMLVKNDKTKEFFDKNQTKMEKLTGRDLGVSIVSQDQFIQILEGEKDKEKLGFNSHKVEVSFLSNKRIF